MHIFAGFAYRHLVVIGLSMEWYSTAFWPTYIPSLSCVPQRQPDLLVVTRLNYQTITPQYDSLDLLWSNIWKS